jgi:hypothetical protein
MAMINKILHWISGYSQRPEIIIDIVFDNGLLFISVKNIGKRSACRVSVDFDREIIGLEGTKEISGLPLFENIEYMPPQKEIVTFLDSSASYFAREEPSRFATTVTCRDERGRNYNKTIRHNLDIYREIGYLPGYREEMMGKKINGNKREESL